MPSSACDWSSDVCSSDRSEEHTSELQSRSDLVCRLLLEKKKNKHELQSRSELECHLRIEKSNKKAECTNTYKVTHTASQKTALLTGSKTRVSLNGATAG